MATITLYKDKVNGVGSLLDDIIKSVDNLDVQLGTLKSTLQGVDSSTCNLQDTVDSISSSSQSEEDKIEDLQRLNSELTTFIETATNRDNSACDAINEAKEDFYTDYYYLKPECEKSTMEKVRDALKSACEWCCEHWKLIVTAIIVVVSIVVLCIPGVGPIIAGACWGAILGAVIGGVSGGLESLANGGSFLDGFEDGAFSGAISGAIMGGAMAGLGQLGAAAGKGISCMSKLGKFVKGTAAVTKVLDTSMGAFDTIAMIDRLIGPGNISALNARLHESTAYNIFQTGVSAVAAFTGGMTTTMKCFVAGTLVLTANGLVHIEAIKAGDKVLSTDPETMTTEYKTVLETYVREEDRLVHLVVGGEEIVSTVDHPFYVKGKGFVYASDLYIGAELIDKDGNTVTVSHIYREKLENGSTNVYNFKVEDFHTYYVGECGIWVHNADCMPTAKQKGFVKSEENPDGSITVTKNIDGKNVDVTYTMADDGHYYPQFEKYADYRNPAIDADFSKPIKVEGKMTGNYANDSSLINQQLGLSETPTGYVWHHVEDGKSMLLVQQKIHSIKFGGFTHRGGASIIRANNL